MARLPSVTIGKAMVTKSRNLNHVFFRVDLADGTRKGNISMTKPVDSPGRTL
jgi:hypothetical protein